MPASNILRRSKPSLIMAELHASPSEEPPAFSYSMPLAKAFAVRPVLRVGDYEVGETYCPGLCGHPGIRY
ncbi:hypothetical protein GCM10022409_23480 [Hymenobacter glaciei]|uniref:Uncharacterized protein n=1 Tax=Hymenobacter glaciei TaxID=877209 RepID=A0ABP7U874_9BACT